MRHICSGEQAHLCEAQRTQKGRVCRCDRNRRKGKAFTRGYLDNHEFGYVKESAEAIVAIGNEPRMETVEVSQVSEGLNVKQLQMPNGSANWRKPPISATGKKMGNKRWTILKVTKMYANH